MIHVRGRRAGQLLLLALAALTLCGIVAASQNIMLTRGRPQVASIPIVNRVAFHLAQWYTWIPAVLPALFVMEQMRRRMLLLPLLIVTHVLLCAIAVILHSAGVIAVDFLFYGDMMTVSAWTAFVGHLRGVILIEVLAYLGIVAAWFSVQNAWEARSARANAALLEADLARTELQVLHAQLQPHFLFNTLQAIATINARDSKLGTQTLLELGDLYRSVLATSGRQVQPLRDEIAFLDRYVGIEKLRMQERLQIEFHIDDALHDVLVPHFILQPLVENAIEHGIAPKTGASTLQITANASDRILTLEVRDTGLGISTSAIDGTGISITKSRLANLYGTDAALELVSGGTGTVARITMPLERP